MQVENNGLRVAEQAGAGAGAGAGTLLPGQRGGDTPHSHLTTVTTTSPQHLDVVIPPASHSEIAGVVKPVREVGPVSGEEHQLCLELSN